MKPPAPGNLVFHNHAATLARALMFAVFLLGAASSRAQLDLGGTNSTPGYIPLDSWSFADHTNWTSDYGYAPVSFTNLAFSQLGNFQSLVVDTNVPAWLQYNVQESDGTTNLTVPQGSVTFWFAPGSWASTNLGGGGPGEWGRLFEAGTYTTNSSFGWWSLYVDPAGANLYFSTQTNDLSGNYSNYITMPIAWTTNYFHFIALTYSATNTALYLDGVLATNGPGVTVYPGPDMLASGFFIGSASNGVDQAHGLFNNVATFNTPLDAGTIQEIYGEEREMYGLNPFNTAMETLTSSDSEPSTSATPDVITGPGSLQWDGTAPVAYYGTNADQVWITNTTAAAAGNGTENVTFTIQGGLPGNNYDVFANGALVSGPASVPWVWLGQGTNSGIYTVNLDSGTAFLILGTPLDTDGDGLTDAYENLASKTDPGNPDTDGDGIPDGWAVLLGLNPLGGAGTQPLSRSNYGYTPADWLDGVTGIRSGAVTTDNEGNVLTVSQ